ncbi:hypothetical protein LQV05_000429 [Cryptococcus neoformans]|nr:hypothetical protein LQV05_000429 [Cryptococcus neoformans]
MSSGAIILINGYPGVGKVSMAKQLSKLLPNSRVFDNNFMGDAARLFDKRSELEAYNALRQGMVSFSSTLFSLVRPFDNLKWLVNPTREAKSRLTDEGTLMALRMEEEVGTFYGSVTRKMLDGLGGKYEINTENVDVRIATAIIREYKLDALRQEGW